MLGSFKVMLMSALLFISKMIVAGKIQKFLVATVGVVCNNQKIRKMGIKEMDNKQIINFAFIMGIFFTYINKFVAEKLLAKIFVA
jgi:hypothetical protein